ncbi:MAG: heme lyase CcmF/NrfE family subunit [Actinobacteria bacterium]|nr:MAG: heme lyase CcmF/NrfE family subunit [Actinomycetota bacterium]
MSTLSAATTARASPRRRSRRSARPSTRRLRASALMQDLGRAALVLAFGLVVYAAIGGGLGAYTRRRRLVASARNALFASFGKALPFPYVYTAFWGGQEGSLLLWLLVLTGIGSAAVAFNRRLTTEVLPWTVPVLGGVATFFALLLVFVASPFATQVAPADGAGLNPSLQNPYMMIHPPLLYLGYVGLTIPFAFAAGALLSGRFDERWIVATRRWTILAWTALGIGILLGAKWAYEEVGWGGYYAWDPVENAALMPWLAATAYLHSVMVQEKKNMLRVWNATLVTGAFCLSIFGTFLTRSGLINSIHSFAQSPIGAWFLGFIALAATFSTVLIIWRLPLLRARTKLESLASREAAFLYNNLLLVAFTLTVIWGVAFPLLSDAVRGEAVTVGPPYYDFFLKVFGLPLLLLMGIGPLVAWRRTSLRALGETVLGPALAALSVGVILIALGAGSSPAGLLAYTFSVFALAAIVLEFTRGTRARKALGAPSWWSAFSGLVARNRRRYGGYVVHAAVVLLAIGVAGSSAYGATKIQRFRPGDTMKIRGYTLTYLNSVERHSANHDELRARVAVTENGKSVGTITPGKNSYFAEQQTSNEVAIKHDWLRAQDLFVIGDEFKFKKNAVTAVYLKVLVKPLVNLIWLAGFVFLLGSVITLWPDAREQRRLAARSEPGVPFPVPGRS